MPVTGAPASIEGHRSRVTAPRSAVIGLGGMGLRHLRSLQALHWPVAAVVDRRGDRFPLAREIIPDIPEFDDVTRMLAEVRPELVVVATNGPSHAQLAAAAMDAGARFIACEKPMATSVADCDAMIASATHCGVRLGINHARRYAESYRALRTAVADGAVGRIRLVTGALGAAVGVCSAPTSSTSHAS